ncbi:MAG: glycosyltransferase, partial [Candidatus Omnitrophica bacterium]|nr:glycosyltransferase [Candidatus Omnitrophota bacterium]
MGYWVRGTGIWLTDGPLADNMDRRPAASAILELANCLIEDRSNKTNLNGNGVVWFTSLDKEHVNLLLDHYNIRQEDLLIGIHPGSRHKYARWVNERFALVGDELVSKYNARVIFTGSGNDIATVKDITGLMKKDAIILAGRTTLRQLAAIIKRCRIYISVDTGPLHMAVSLGTPAISLFSGRDFPEKWAPYGNMNIVIRKDILCSPCFKRDCNDNKCMKMIETSDVLEAVEQLIRGRFYFSKKIEPSPTTKINVLQVITGLGIGGTERVVYSIAKSLDPAKYRVIVCCLKEDGIIADEIRNSGVKVINLKSVHPWDVRSLLTLSKIIKEEEIDLVHTHIARADVIGGLAARLTGVPVISTVHHTYEPWEGHPFYGNIYRKTLNSFNRIIAVSEAVREYLMKWGRVPQEKITVIYNGIDISEYDRVDLKNRDSSV